jgi:phospholipid transport system transporter-binding protein
MSMTALALPSLLTHDQAATCALSLGAGIRAEKSGLVAIDASGLEKFDSSALAVLLQCRRESTVLGKRFEVTGLPHELRELAGLYGIDELLEGRRLDEQRKTTQALES